MERKKRIFGRNRRSARTYSQNTSRRFASGGTATIRCLNVLSEHNCEWTLRVHHRKTQLADLVQVDMLHGFARQNQQYRSASTICENILAEHNSQIIIRYNCYLMLRDQPSKLKRRVITARRDLRDCSSACQICELNLRVLTRRSQKDLANLGRPPLFSLIFLVLYIHNI